MSRKAAAAGRRGAVLALWVALATASLAAPARAEREPVLEAADLVDASLLSGPGWRVEDKVPLRGYQARFTLHTDWGVLQADSVDLLAVRVSEMPALEALHRASVSQVLMESTAGRFGEPVNAVGAVGGSPMRAAAGLPRGVARYFGERWEKLRSRARKLADRGHDLVFDDGSAYDNPGSVLGAAGNDEKKRSRGWWSRRGREVMNLAKSEVGYGSARKHLADRLAVDPYTRNPLIRPRLDALAWAETSGRFATGELLGLLGGPVGDIVSYSVQVNRLVLEAAPAQLKRRNQDILDQHCVDERLVRGFLDDGAYSPGLQTEFTDLLVALDPSEGCEALLETALMASDEPQARFVVNGLRLMKHALGAEAPGGRFVPQGALLAYETTTGEFVLPLAVDWLAWTPEIRRWFDLPSVGNRPHRTVLVAGGISGRAERELTERGWSLVTRLPYPGAPRYRRPLVFEAPDTDPTR